MIEKLFGLIKVKECMSRINIIRNDYEDKLTELRDYISKIEDKANNLEDEVLRLKVQKGRNFKLENENEKLKKENELLKKQLSNKEYMGLSNRVAWELARELAK